MLRKTEFVIALNFGADEQEEFVFEGFKNLIEYNSTKEYYLVFDHEYYTWDVYEILPK